MINSISSLVTFHFVHRVCKELMYAQDILSCICVQVWLSISCYVNMVLNCRPNYFIMEMEMMDNKTLVKGNWLSPRIVVWSILLLSTCYCWVASPARKCPIWVWSEAFHGYMDDLFGDVESTCCSISASDHFGIYNCGQVAVNLVNILGPDSILESNI